MGPILGVCCRKYKSGRALNVVWYPGHSQILSRSQNFSMGCEKMWAGLGDEATLNAYFSATLYAEVYFMELASNKLLEELAHVSFGE